MENSGSEEIFDVVVIGGGPAGMMAAGRAAEKGARVLLLEKNDKLGKKLLITGGGRCNLTNSETDVRKFLSKYKDGQKFLFSAFSLWSVQNTLDFFNNRGLPTKVEAENRVFPATDKAESVWQVMMEYLSQNNVAVRTKANVIGFNTEGGKIASVVLSNKKEIRAHSFILATGGLSHPETGSTGDGFLWLERLGHKIWQPRASLVPIAIRDVWWKKISGISFADMKITAYQNNVKQDSRRGKVLFTHFGLSGPAILNMSNEIGELLKYGEVELRLDLFPNMDPGAMNEMMQKILSENSNQKIKNSLGKILPSGLITPILELCQIEPEKWSHSITRKERIELINKLKSISVFVKNLLGEDKAIVTSGGADLNEVDFKTMRSKLIPNLYLVGDVLNIDRPSGGYSLQLCWTSGFVAGENCF